MRAPNLPGLRGPRLRTLYEASYIANNASYVTNPLLYIGIGATVRRATAPLEFLVGATAQVHDGTDRNGK